MRIFAGHFHFGIKIVAAALAVTTALSGCEKSSSGDGRAGLRVMTADERAQDFDQLLQLFKSYYGPYQYKEALLGFKIGFLKNIYGPVLRPVICQACDRARFSELQAS